jgi:phage portal protein BeeE
MSEIQTDRQATTFKSKFFANSATPQIIVTLDAQTTQAQAEDIADSIARGHEGANAAYKTLVLGGGADVTVAGSNLGQLDLKNTQGLDETRIALRSRVPATILGISEGLAGSALNAGNYSQTRRLWSDAWFIPTAQNLCGSLERILVLPPGRTAELSFDPAQIEFLQEDRRDEADIRGQKASTMRQLIEAGFVPSTVTQYVATGDESVLQHTGNVSVQLQPAGTTEGAV